MHHFKKLATVLIAIGSIVAISATADTAEARRWARRAYYAPPAARTYRYGGYGYGRYGSPYRYSTGYRGYGGYGYGGYGYGRGITVGAPGVGVRIGF